MRAGMMKSNSIGFAVNFAAWMPQLQFSNWSFALGKTPKFKISKEEGQMNNEQ
jgi:hypothetical protein